MLAKHTQRIYMDIEDVERGAGRMELEALGKDVESPDQMMFYQGAACVLRMVSLYDIKGDNDLKALLDRCYQLVRDGEKPY